MKDLINAINCFLKIHVCSNNLMIIGLSQGIHTIKAVPDAYTLYSNKTLESISQRETLPSLYTMDCGGWHRYIKVR